MVLFIFCYAQDRIRSLHRGLLKNVCSVFPVEKTSEFLVLGLSSKNTKTRVECIEVRGAGRP